MIEDNNYNLSNYYEDVSKISTILLRKDITTKDIYIILLAAKLINKNFNIEDVYHLLEHIESLFQFLQTNKFTNKEDFNKWEKQMLDKIKTKKEENI